jgi:cation diffusion facilitator family transporter
MPRLFGHVPRDESRAALVALLAGSALMALKFVAYFLTGSAVIFSDAVESIVNVAAAAFALYSIVIAHRPADASHPYGHGKVEFISAGFEGGMILVAAVVSAVKAIDDLLRRRDLSTGRLDWALALMALALLVNGALGFWLVRTGRRQGSITLEADGHHLLTDALTSVVAIVALSVVRVTGWRWADPVAALLVAAYISRTGVRLLGHAVGGLMDRQDVEDEALLRRILDSHVGTGGKDPRICGYHKLRHRHSGRYHWVDFHITVPPDWNIDRGHKVASSIEYEIEQALGEGNATAHVEPCTDVACGSCAASVNHAGS